MKYKPNLEVPAIAGAAERPAPTTWALGTDSNVWCLRRVGDRAAGHSPKYPRKISKFSNRDCPGHHIQRTCLVLQ